MAQVFVGYRTIGPLAFRVSVCPVGFNANARSMHLMCVMLCRWATGGGLCLRARGSGLRSTLFAFALSSETAGRSFNHSIILA